MTSTRTDTYALAHLAGGPPRVADTAVVALLERGRLLVDDDGLLRTTGSAPVHPVEAAVLDLVGPTPRRSAPTVRSRLAEDPRVVAVADRLVAQGLSRPNPWTWLGSSRPARVPTAAGRRLLAEARQSVAGQDLRVALDGVAVMTDQELRDRVFGSTRTRPAGRAQRHPGFRDGGSSTGWLFAGGGGDGGGAGWGGDGGGCGGGDGGGGGGGGC